MMHGMGKMTNQDGTSYVGMWAFNKMNGEGVYIDAHKARVNMAKHFRCTLLTYKESLAKSGFTEARCDMTQWKCMKSVISYRIIAINLKLENLLKSK